jgi:hypothetical protein
MESAGAATADEAQSKQSEKNRFRRTLNIPQPDKRAAL